MAIVLEAQTHTAIRTSNIEELQHNAVPWNGQLKIFWGFNSITRL